MLADLPVEVLHVIAYNGYAAVRAMLAIPAFARSLTPSIRWDYRIAFGETVEIYGHGMISIWWKLNGNCHRVDGPAVEFANGRREWFINGKCHRVNGPAITHADGSRGWYINGRRHRIDGPAIIYADGSCKWYNNGTLHRDNGPAVINADGTCEYWLSGVMQLD